MVSGPYLGTCTFSKGHCKDHPQIDHLQLLESDPRTYNNTIKMCKVFIKGQPFVPLQAWEICQNRCRKEEAVIPRVDTGFFLLDGTLDIAKALHGKVQLSLIIEAGNNHMTAVIVGGTGCRRQAQMQINCNQYHHKISSQILATQLRQ
jgi:hypothetical protein